MPKQKKLTPKELYWAKKNKEEQERAAYPPPGLINHGNTCFMNSVLQGLFATDLLRRMVEFQSQNGDGSSSDSLLAIPSPSRSPLLTNGRGPKDAQQEWCEGLSVGDIFIRTLERAWTMRDKKDRANMSPKELLAALGKKYDQYLDFRQQDAHEFFIHLLDCMRMEEIDIIKKRQPPLPKAPAQSRPNNTNIPTDNKHTTLQLISEEERLMPFVDMIWGGRFTSYLICTTCKHVSHTYEDFDGLSLPIRHDESKERKRDRLRAFASKFMATSGGTHQWHAVLLPRAQSQPPSPRLTSRRTEQKFELGDIPESTRRRSFELTVGSLSISNMNDEIPKKTSEEDGSLNVEKTREKILEEISNVAATILPSDITNPISGTSTPDLSDVPDKLAAAGVATQYQSSVPSSASASTRTLPVVSSVASGTQWSKKVSGRISRRISLTMSKSGKLGEMMKTTAKDKMEKSDSEAGGGVSAALEKLTGKSTPVSEDANTEASTSRLQSIVAPSTSEHGHTKTKRRSALLLHNRLREREREPRQKTQVPASDRDALEAAYLTRILQDTPATYSVLSQLLTASAGSAESLVRTGSTSSSGSGSGSGMHALMAQLSRLNIGGANQSIEECLRTFTAVEALDGENMFGCHMCWKIAHGKMSVSARRRTSGDDSSDEEERQNDTPLDKSPIPRAAVPRPPFMLSETGRANTSSSIASVSSVPSTTSTKSTVFAQWAPDSGGAVVSSNKESEDANQSTDNQVPSTLVKTRRLSEDSPVSNASSVSADSSSVKSDKALTICTSPGSAVENKGSETTISGLVTPEIPTIAMTMSSPISPEDVQQEVRGFAIPMLNGILPDEKNVLRPPERSFRSSGQFKDGFSSESSMTSPSSEDEQGEMSNISDASSVPAFVGPTSGLNGSTNNSPRRSRSGTIPRSKQVIYRRALKRYLISDPPPILVIHLKRFQQVSKSSLALFGNLKKLDDYVSFPEYLNLQPFLAPRKEDYGLGRGEMEGRVAEKGTRMEDKPCIGRLYAVIVHIGNLLGGHYVAYTALPPNDPILQHSQDTEKDKDKSRLSEPGKRSETQSSRAGSRQWCYISDTEVRLVSLDEVLKAKAYLCMYERIVD